MEIYFAAPFLVGTPPPETQPLARYLPPVPAGPVAAWLSARITPGGWVLDPFGASPRVIVEAARSGYRILVAANNPISRFLIEMAAKPPTVTDLQGALAELGFSRKEKERLEPHLLSLYETPCQKCRKIISAEAFIWDSKTGKIAARIYNCPNCGDTGERPPDPGDERRAARFTAAEAMHRSRALERVAPRDDPDRPHAEEALSIYLPRAVYALGTIINRLDQLQLTSTRRRALTALMLTACDQASSLWPHPTERPRPKQLTTPTRFRENNVWKALEEGISLWAANPETIPIPISTFPNLPEAAGICIFDGAMRDLASKLGEIPISAAIAAIPRPNQAFWTLSSLWTGWLWGRESASPFKVGLRRRRYDWQWHTEALTAIFGSLAKALPLGAPFFAQMPEAEPPFISAAMLAIQQTGLLVESVAFRSASDPVQFVIQRPEKPAQPATAPKLAEVLETYLRQRGEPATYLHIHLLSTVALASQNALPLGENAIPAAAELIQNTLRARVFTHYDAKSVPESGTRGLAKPDPAALALVDLMEMGIVRHLQAHPGCSLDDLQSTLNAEFPGLLTPPLGLIGAVLDSYAVDENGWRLRPEDAPAARRADLKQAVDMLTGTGKRLGFSVSTSAPNLLLWTESDHTAMAFYLTASAVVGKILHTRSYPPEKTVLVLPGGRAGLLEYKLRRDPTLRHKAEGWRFLKFRHLRQIAEITLLTREAFQLAINEDPIEQAEIQMMMF